MPKEVLPLDLLNKQMFSLKEYLEKLKEREKWNNQFQAVSKKLSKLGNNWTSGEVIEFQKLKKESQEKLKELETQLVQLKKQTDVIKFFDTYATGLSNSLSSYLEKKRELESLKEEKEKELEKVLKRIRGNKKSKEEIEKSFRELTEKINSLKNSEIELKELEAKKGREQNYLNKLNQKISSKDSSIETLKKEIEEKFQEIQSICGTNENSIIENFLSIEKEKLNELIKNIKINLLNHDNLIDQFNNESIKSYNAKLGNVNEELNELKIKDSQLAKKRQSWWRKAFNIFGVNKSLNKEIEENQREIKNKTEEKLQLEKNGEEFEKLRKELETAESIYLDNVAKYEAINSNIKFIESFLEQRIKKENQLKIEQQAKAEWKVQQKQTILKIQNFDEKITKIKDQLSNSKSVEQLEKDIASLKAQQQALSSVDEDVKNVQKMQKEIEDLIKDIVKTEQSITENERCQNYYDESIEWIEQEIKNKQLELDKMSQKRKQDLESKTAVPIMSRSVSKVESVSSAPPIISEEDKKRINKKKAKIQEPINSAQTMIAIITNMSIQEDREFFSEELKVMQFLNMGIGILKGIDVSNLNEDFTKKQLKIMDHLNSFDLSWNIENLIAELDELEDEEKRTFKEDRRSLLSLSQEQVPNSSNHQNDFLCESNNYTEDYFSSSLV